MSPLPSADGKKFEPDPADGRGGEIGPAMPEGDELYDDFGDSAAWDGAGQGGGNRFVGQGSLLIVAIALVAAGALYAMRITSGDLTQSLGSEQVQAKIETYLAKLNNPDKMSANDPLKSDNFRKMIEDVHEIIEVLNYDAGDRQVPVEFVQKNPFALIGGADTADADADAATREAEKLLKMLKAELSKLDLQTVMKGRRPVAVINGEFYTKGDPIGSFVVTQIFPDSQSLELTADDKVFTLTMD